MCALPAYYLSKAGIDCASTSLLQYEIDVPLCELQFPDIEFNTDYCRTGSFGSTKDGLPFIGPYKPLPNSYFSLGFGGNGITFSLIAAEIIRDLILGKENDDAKIFAFQRG